MFRLAGLFAAIFAVTLSTSGCTVKEAGSQTSGGSTNGKDLAGTIDIDGSSTVLPISRAAAEEFQKLHPDVKVVVGGSGTGGGFKQFGRAETDISNASRPIAESEIALCKEGGVEYVELKIAIDGLSVVVSKENDWCDCLTVAQLAAIWQPDSEVNKWSDLDPSWPNQPFKLYGPDTDSGTFDYFTEVIVGKAKKSRNDYSGSSDDNVLVHGIAGDKYSLGYFGFAYYIENRDKLKLLGVSKSGEKSDCVQPSIETVLSGEYSPLSRPLFVYVNKAALKKPQVVAYLEFLLREGQQLVKEEGFVNLSDEDLADTQHRLAEAIAGKSEPAAEKSTQ